MYRPEQHYLALALLAQQPRLPYAKYLTLYSWCLNQHPVIPSFAVNAHAIYTCIPYSQPGNQQRISSMSIFTSVGAVGGCIS